MSPHVITSLLHSVKSYPRYRYSAGLFRLFVYHWALDKHSSVRTTEGRI